MATILIADPDPDTRTILRSALRHEQFRVIEAADPETAHQVANSCLLDVVVLNYPMRLRTGVTLTRALREIGRFQYLPIINLTSHVTRELLADARSDGVTRTLPKPASVASVLTIIRAVTDPRVLWSRIKTRPAGA